MGPVLKALRVAGLVALVSIFCFSPSAASAASLRPAVDIAQSLAPIAADSTASSTASGGSTSTTTTSTGSSDEIYLGFAALGFGFIALVSVLMFVRRDRQQALQIQQQLVTSGVTVQPQQVPAGPPDVAAPVAPTGTNPITIEGPDTVTVGQTVDFIARQQGNQAVAPWTAQPAGILSLPAESTSRASITALKAGQVTLSAGTSPNHGVKQLLVSPAPSAAPQGLLFIGAGWGTVVVAWLATWWPRASQSRTRASRATRAAVRAVPPYPRRRSRTRRGSELCPVGPQHRYAAPVDVCRRPNVWFRARARCQPSRAAHTVVRTHSSSWS